MILARASWELESKRQRLRVAVGRILADEAVEGLVAFAGEFYR